MLSRTRDRGRPARVCATLILRQPQAIKDGDNQSDVLYYYARARFVGSNPAQYSPQGGHSNSVFHFDAVKFQRLCVRPCDGHQTSDTREHGRSNLTSRLVPGVL